MSQVFVWRPSDAFRDRSEERFAAVLEEWRHAHAHAYQRSFRAWIRGVGNVWIGQLVVDDGIDGWSPRFDAGGRGVAWSGVCEDFLGRADAHEVAAEATRAVFERPAAAAEWQGAFGVVAWDEARGEVALLTSATQPQPMWRTAGPAGWAAGSRARPLVDLVGREPELDEVQASLFLSFGYLAGDGCLFRGVKRLGSRRRISLRRGEAPVDEPYISIPEFLMSGDTRGQAFEATVAFAAERFRERVQRQLRYSRDPMLSLTGGRDSRCIAAALHAVGYAGPAQTGGPAESADVVIGALVARTLGFDHATSQSDTDLLALMTENLDRAETWTELSEGIETIRHVLHFPRFFRDPGSLRDEIRQTFNGLTPGLTVRSEGSWGWAATLARIHPALHARAAAKRELHEVADRVRVAVTDLGGDEEDWTELFFWQSRAQQWGQDNSAAKFGLTWWWTPLMDPTLVRSSFWLPREAKRSKRLVQSMTTYLAPELAGVPYEGVSVGTLEKLWSRVRRKVSSHLGTRGPGRSEADAARRRSWERFLFQGESRVWPSLIDEASVREALHENANAHLLWSIATVELFADAHLRDSRARV